MLDHFDRNDFDLVSGTLWAPGRHFENCCQKGKAPFFASWWNRSSLRKECSAQDLKTNSLLIPRSDMRFEEWQEKLGSLLLQHWIFWTYKDRFQILELRGNLSSHKKNFHCKEIKYVDSMTRYWQSPANSWGVAWAQNDGSSEATGGMEGVPQPPHDFPFCLLLNCSLSNSTGLHPVNICSASHLTNSSCGFGLINYYVN